MQIRKFVGINIPEAMGKVKAEFGPNAVILGTRKFRPGDARMKLFTRPLCEVTAAIDYETPAPKPPLAAGRLAYAAANEGAIPKMPARPAEPDSRRTAPDLGRAPGPRRAIHEKSIGTLLAERLAECAPAPRVEAPLGVAAPEQLAPLREEIAALRREAVGMLRMTDLTAGHPELERELGEIRQLLEGRAETGGAALNTTADLPQPARSMVHALMSQGVDEEVVTRIVSRLRLAVHREPERFANDESAAPALVRAELAAQLRAQPHREEGIAAKPFICALVGPTGVGKTTTLAKLAARRLLRGQSVGLISLDTYRVAAAEQIQTYAKIMHAPIAIAHNDAEFRAALTRMRDKDCIFIDTAGHSQKQYESLENQVNVLLPCRPHVSLVLSLTARESVLNQVAEIYGRPGFDDLIFTKLDEVASLKEELGAMLNVSARCGKPAAFLTSGQKVPEDIHPATPGKLVDLLLEGGLDVLD